MIVNILLSLSAALAIAAASPTSSTALSSPTGAINLPANAFGIAEMFLGSSSLPTHFDIIDTAYFRPYGSCNIPEDAAEIFYNASTNPALPEPAIESPKDIELNVYKPCDPSTYQYMFLNFTSPASFALRISHTVLSSSYKISKVNVVRNATFVFSYLNSSLATPHNYGFLPAPKGTVTEGLAPDNWQADTLAPLPHDGI